MSYVNPTSHFGKWRQKQEDEQRRAIVRAAVITIILGAVAVVVTGWPHGLFTAALTAIAFFVEKHP